MITKLIKLWEDWEPEEDWEMDPDHDEDISSSGIEGGYNLYGEFWSNRYELNDLTFSGPHANSGEKDRAFSVHPKKGILDFPDTWVFPSGAEAHREDGREDHSNIAIEIKKMENGTRQLKLVAHTWKWKDHWQFITGSIRVVWTGPIKPNTVDRVKLIIQEFNQLGGNWPEPSDPNWRVDCTLVDNSKDPKQKFRQF